MVLSSRRCKVSYPRSLIYGKVASLIADRQNRLGQVAGPEKIGSAHPQVCLGCSEQALSSPGYRRCKTVTSSHYHALGWERRHAHRRFRAQRLTS
jgi:hypothetical protein